MGPLGPKREYIYTHFVFWSSKSEDTNGPQRFLENIIVPIHKEIAHNHFDDICLNSFKFVLVFKYWSNKSHNLK